MKIFPAAFLLMLIVVCLADLQLEPLLTYLSQSHNSYVSLL